MVGLRRAVRRGRIRPSLSLKEKPVVFTAVAAREAPDACPSEVCKAASFYILDGGSPPSCFVRRAHSNDRLTVPSNIPIDKVE